MDSTSVLVNEKTETISVPDGKPKIAYFSMEIGINEHIPTYSGGLGILAGDTLKSCADLNVPIVGVTLLSEQGYFYQKIDKEGNQIELPINFSINDFLTLLPSKTSVMIEDRTVHIRIWSYLVKGVNGYIVPVFFLDTNLEENSEWDRELTKHLYGGELKYRLGQEIVLGVGGVRALKALGYKSRDEYISGEVGKAINTKENLAEKWENIRSLRGEVTKALEEARTKKLIGHPLDAALEIKLPDTQLKDQVQN